MTPNTNLSDKLPQKHKLFLMNDKGSQLPSVEVDGHHYWDVLLKQHYADSCVLNYPIEVVFQ